MGSKLRELNRLYRRPDIRAEEVTGEQVNIAESRGLLARNLKAIHTAVRKIRGTTWEAHPSVPRTASVQLRTSAPIARERVEQAIGKTELHPNTATWAVNMYSAASEKKRPRWRMDIILPHETKPTTPTIIHFYLDHIERGEIAKPDLDAIETVLRHLVDK
ncbi:MAG: hypothetical protein V1644_00575 [Candidatus Micrarchaeota archaeon]